MLANIVAKWLKNRISAIEFAKNHALDLQDETLKNRLQSQKDTFFGKKYDFANIRNFAQFQSAVPVHSYEDIAPYIFRMMQGEQNVLVAEKVQFYAKSSGTTQAKSKYIPVTETCLGKMHYASGKDVYGIYHHNNPQSQLYKGKHLSLGGNLAPNPFGEGYVGDLSAIMLENLPFWADLKRVPDKKTALLAVAWEQKIDEILRQVVHEDVYSTVGVPSWLLILLHKLLAEKKVSSIHDIWKNYELCLHGGMNFAPYKKQFEQISEPKRLKFYESYNASEGFFALQSENDADDMLLMTHYGTFYEFMPLSELGQKFPKTLLLDQVQAGVDYALIITTTGGLWRYLIGDTVRFTHLNPYKIQVSGRTQQFINAFGEELMVDNAEKALQKTSEKTQAIVREFTAAPIYIEAGKNGGHEWFIEFVQEPPCMDTFTEILDQELQNLNSDYQAKRSYNRALSMPKVIAVPVNTFYKWLKSKGKLGGQHKVPRLCNDRRYADELKQWI